MEQGRNKPAASNLPKDMTGEEFIAPEVPSPRVVEEIVARPDSVQQKVENLKAAGEKIPDLDGRAVARALIIAVHRRRASYRLGVPARRMGRVSAETDNRKQTEPASKRME